MSRTPGGSDPERDELSEPVARGLAMQPVGPGRVVTYAVRGALTQDIAARHGLSITLEARDLLAEPAGTEGPRGLGAQAMRFVTRRLLGRFGPLGFVPPVRSGLETFVLGHLFARYLESLRTERAARIDVEEARELRRAIDR